MCYSGKNRGTGNMSRLIFILGCLLVFAVPAEARTVKLSDMIAGGTNMPNKKMRGAEKNAQITCTDHKDCPFYEECVGLRCVNVCTADTCITGKYCVPAGPETPHRYKCVECFRNAHCPQGMECTGSFSCAKIDPCRQAVCSPGAPFCVGIPYKTLPYTCVQCTSDAHCPPVGGLTRRCVDHFCLFNVPGNIPAPNPASAPSVQKNAEEIYGENGE